MAGVTVGGTISWAVSATRHVKDEGVWSAKAVYMGCAGVISFEVQMRIPAQVMLHVTHE